MWVLYKIFDKKIVAEKNAERLRKHEPCISKVEEVNNKFAVYVKREFDYWEKKETK